MPDLLPDCRARVTRGRIYRGGQSWIPIFCAHCGKSGGMMPESNDEFFYIQCDDCADRFPLLPGTFSEPIEEWGKRAAGEMEDMFGRVLTAEEQTVQLANPDSKLSLLARDKPRFGGG